LSGRAEGVELHRLVARDTSRQDVALPERDREGQALERDERLAQGGAPVDPVPVRQEAPVRGLLGRLDLLPERRERGATEPAEGVAVAAGVLGRYETALRGHPHLDRAPLREQDRGERLVVLAWPEVSPKAKDVVQFIRVPRIPSELRLHLLDRIAVEEVSELLLAEQLPEKVAVERERLCAPLRRRRVVFVHVVRDVVEEERGRIGRGRGRLHVDEIELPGPEPLEEPLQGRQVEDVLQALAVGLEDDRERAVAARDLEQALRLE